MQPKSQGFTLLEILAALFIFTLVAAILTKTLHSIIVAESTTESKALRLRETQMAFAFFSRDLASLAENSNLNGNENSLAFNKQLFLNTSENEKAKESPAIHYHFKQGSLLRESGALAKPPKAQGRILITQLENINFQYLDSHKQFHAKWPPEKNKATSDKAPIAILLTLTFINGGELQQLYRLPPRQLPYENQ